MRVAGTVCGGVGSASHIGEMGKAEHDEDAQLTPRTKVHDILASNTQLRCSARAARQKRAVGGGVRAIRPRLPLAALHHAALLTERVALQALDAARD